MKIRIFCMLLLLPLSAGLLSAQVKRAARAAGNTDIAESLYGAFPDTTRGNGVEQDPANAAGMLLEMRYIAHPLVGYELYYGFNNADQSYNLQSVKAHSTQVGADWIVSLNLANLRPFAEAGLGLVWITPRSGQSYTRSNTKPAYNYGLGMDWALIPHAGLRFQYRGTLYHAPDLLKTTTSSGKFTRSAEPMIGAYLRF